MLHLIKEMVHFDYSCAYSYKIGIYLFSDWFTSCNILFFQSSIFTMHLEQDLLHIFTKNGRNKTFEENSQTDEIMFCCQATMLKGSEEKYFIWSTLGLSWHFCSASSIPM